MKNKKSLILVATNLETQRVLSFRFEKVQKISKNQNYGFVGKNKTDEPYRFNKKGGKCEIQQETQIEEETIGDKDEEE